MTPSRIASVVVPTRNRGSSIEQTITSILATDPLPLEVIVADQSDPEQAELTERSVARAAAAARLTFRRESMDEAEAPGVEEVKVRYVRCVSRGAGAGRNDGARRARGEFVLYTDDDTTVAVDWIASTEREFVRDGSVVAVYGKILTPTEPGQQQSVRTGTEVTRLGDGALYSAPTLPWYLGSGGNMAFRRAQMLECGGFDEVMTIGGPFRSFEDLDLGHRLLAARAGQVRFCAESVVYHHSTKSFRAQLRTEVGYGIGAGAAFVKYRRCADPLAWPMLRAWVWQMAIRRSAAAVLKWRSLRVLQLAAVQFVAPLIGIARSNGHRIDVDRCLFIPAAASTRPDEAAGSS